MTSNTAPAHPHATGVAVYPALFWFSQENPPVKEVQLWYLVFLKMKYAYIKYISWSFYIYFHKVRLDFHQYVFAEKNKYLSTYIDGQIKLFEH